MTEPFAGNNLCEYINGLVKSKGEIKDGKLDGKWTWWYKDGQKGLEKNYKDGKLDVKVIINAFKDDQEDGLWPPEMTVEDAKVAFADLDKDNSGYLNTD